MARLAITNPGIADYLLKIQTRRHPVLRPMEAYAAQHGFPIIGPLVGPILYQLARMIGAKRVFELGSGYGYSAVWFSQAVGPRGRVFMTEGDAENSARAMRYLTRARLASRVTPLVGDALTLLARERGPFDVILNDIDKWQYPEALPLVRKKLRRGGLFITDNMLWSGRVLGKAADANTRGIVKLTKMLYAAPDFFTVLLPVRDGVSVSLKL